MASEKDWLDDYLRREREKEEKARRVVDYLVPALRFLGVQKVTVEFDGYGDSGEVRDPTFTPTPAAAVPEGLGALIVETCSRMLPGGWEINEGSFGTFTIDVAAGTHHLEQHHREENEVDEDDEEGEE
jgi:hypothetical protein